MKKIIIAEASAVILAFSILAIFVVPTGFASRGGDSGGEASAATSCDDKTMVFPASIYTRLNTDVYGGVSGFEIHLANADGDCSAMLFSSNAAESRISLSQHQKSGDMAFALR